MKRRTLLSWTVKGAGLVVAGAVAIPAVIHSLSPVIDEEDKEEWRTLGSIDNFPIGKVVKSEVSLPVQLTASNLQEKAVYVWRRSDDEFIVYSRACTDLGCPVNWDPGSEWFFCPCHGGIFDKEGNRRAGPPKRPLWRYSNRVRNGVLEINLRSVPPMV